jgi:hypothetical protein
MEELYMNMRVIIACLAASAALCAISGTASAQIFVTNQSLLSSGTVGEYATSGEPINPALISGLFEPGGIAISGDRLFVKTGDFVSEYKTSGALVNPSLISGVGGLGNIAVAGENLFVTHDAPFSDSDSAVGKYTTSGATVDPVLVNPRRVDITDIAVSADKLFLALESARAIAEYTTSGALVNPNLVSFAGPDFSGPRPVGIAISGDRLFVLSLEGDNVLLFGTVGEYTLSGTPVNPTLITGLDTTARDIAVSGDKLFVLNSGQRVLGVPGTIGEYTTSGEIVNATLVSGLDNPALIAVVSGTTAVPDASSTWTLLLLAVTTTFSLTPLLRRSA